MRVWTILTSGVITQQLANAPQEPFEQGSRPPWDAACGSGA